MRARRKRASRGWKTGTIKEFLALAPEDAALIELHPSLSDGLKAWRKRRPLPDLAAAVQSSQSRVARMEAGDPAVSIDLLVRTLLALGASGRDLARIIESR